MSAEFAIRQAYREFLSLRKSRIGDLKVDFAEHWVDEGEDSTVIKNLSENKIYKYYQNPRLKGQLGTQMLVNYKILTNYANQASLDENWSLSIDLNGGRRELKIPIRINPIVELIQDSEYKCWVGVSPYVSGPRLSDHSYFDKLGDGEHIISQLADIGRMIGNRFGFSGVSIMSFNIKVQNKESKYYFVITDLCASITSLSQKSG